MNKTLYKTVVWLKYTKNSIPRDDTALWSIFALKHVKTSVKVTSMYLYSSMWL